MSDRDAKDRFMEITGLVNDLIARAEQMREILARIRPDDDLYPIAMGAYESLVRSLRYLVSEMDYLVNEIAKPPKWIR